MALDDDPGSGLALARRGHLDAPVLVTCLIAALAAVGCVVLSIVHAYDFAILLLGGGEIPARNAALFAACAWLAGALAFGLGSGLLVRLMCRINGSAASPSDDVTERLTRRGRPLDGSGRRR